MPNFDSVYGKKILESQSTPSLVGTRIVRQRSGKLYVAAMSKILGL